MKDSPDPLYGDWQAMTGVLAGTAMPEEMVSATKLTIGDDQYAVDLAGNIDRGSCSINWDSQPIKLMIEGKQGPNSGKTFLAILEFMAEDEIRVAYDLSGTGYPESFASSTDASNYVATFRKC